MEKRTLKSFNQQLSWSSKLYILLVVATLVLSIFLDAWSGYWQPTILGAIVIVSLVDVVGIFQSKYPGILKKIGWVLLLILLLITLSGLLSVS